MTDADVKAIELAKAEEVGKGQVSRWRGGELPHELRLPSLATRLGVRLKWLKSGQGEMRIAPGENGGEPQPVVSEATIGWESRTTLARAVEIVATELRLAALRSQGLPPDKVQELSAMLASAGGKDAVAALVEIVEAPELKGQGEPHRPPLPESPESPPRVAGG
jgi:hypothetical protein